MYKQITLLYLKLTQHCESTTLQYKVKKKLRCQRVGQSGQKSESCSVVSDSLRPHGLYSPWNSPGQNTGVGSCSLLQGIFQTQGWNPGLPHCRRILYQLSHKGTPRILEWVAYLFSRGTQELNSGLLYCRQILYQLSYQGSP